MSDDIARRHLHGVVENVEANILPHGQVRASHPLRDRYIGRLVEAETYGALTREECTARTAAAHAAITERDLQNLESDLPDLRRHLGQVRGTSFYDQGRAWLKIPLHRHIAHITLLPFFALWIALGIILPVVYIPNSNPGLQGGLIACFVITGICGFVVNAIAYGIWSNE